MFIKTLDEDSLRNLGVRHTHVTATLKIIF